MAEHTTSWHGGSREDAPATEYESRRTAAAERAAGLGLSKAWIARRIRRTRPHVSAVLCGRQRGPKTLELVEELLTRVESGEIEVRR